MDENEMMIICEIAKPELRDKLLELYRKDRQVESNEVDCCPNCGQRINTVGKTKS